MTATTISGKRLLLALSLASVMMTAGLLAAFAAQPGEDKKEKNKGQ